MFKFVILAFLGVCGIRSQITIRNPREYYTIDVDLENSEQYKFKQFSPAVELCLEAQKQMAILTDYNPVSISYWRMVWFINDKVTRMSSYRSDGYDLLINLAKKAKAIYDHEMMKFQAGKHKRDQPLTPYLIDVISFLTRFHSKSFFMNHKLLNQLLSTLIEKKNEYMKTYFKDVKIDNKYKNGQMINTLLDIMILLDEFEVYKEQFNDARVKLEMHLEIIAKTLKNQDFIDDIKVSMDKYHEIKGEIFKLDLFYLEEGMVEDMKLFITDNITNAENYKEIVDKVVHIYRRKKALEKMEQRLNVILKLFLNQKINVDQQASNKELEKIKIELKNLFSDVENQPEIEDEDAQKSTVNNSKSVFKRLIKKMSLNKNKEKKKSNEEDKYLKIDDLKKKITKIEKALAKEDKELEKNLKQLRSKFNRAVKKVEDKIKKYEGYEKYKASVKKVISKINRIAKATSDCQTVNAQIAEEEMRMSTFRKNKNMEQGYYQIQKKLDPTTEQDEQGQAQTAKAFVIAKDMSTVIFERIKGIAEMMEPIQVFQHSKMSEKVKDIINWYNPLHFQDTENFRKPAIILMLKQLMRIHNINTIESKMDRELAKVLAYINNHIGMFRCFSKQDLSFMFFKMIKTNMVIFEKDFVNTFLKQLDYRRQKEFILYNYSLVTNPSFMNDLQGRYDFKRNPTAEKIFYRRMRKKFVNDYCMLINLYKDLTRFRVDSMNAKQDDLSRKQRFIRGVWSIIPFDKAIAFGGRKLVKFILKRIFEAIPFIGNIPWLSKFLAELVAYLLFFIFNYIRKVLSKNHALQQKLSEMKNGVLKLFSSKQLIDLDYNQYIEDKLRDDDNDFSDQLSIKPEKVETQFHEGLNKHDPANYEDLFFTTKNYFYMITPEDQNKNFPAIAKAISEAKTRIESENFFGEKFYKQNYMEVPELQGSPQEKEDQMNTYLIRRIYGQKVLDSQLENNPPQEVPQDRRKVKRTRKLRERKMYGPIYREELQ